MRESELRQGLKRLYPDITPAAHNSLMQAVPGKEQTVMKRKLGLTPVLALLILLCCGVDGGLWWLAALMVLLAGMILAGMGVTGEYIARIYDETRNRPLYIVGETLGFDENAQ